MHPLRRDFAELMPEGKRQGGGRGRGGRYANFVGEFAVIEHRPVHRAFRTEDDVAGDREGWMRIAVLPHVTTGENDRERPLYSARLGVGTRSVHKYRVQRRHQQFIAIISGVLTALSATGVLGGGCNGRYAERLENGVGWRPRETERERERFSFWNTTARLHERLICMTNYAVYPLRLHSSCARRCRTVTVTEIHRVPKTDRVINWLRITTNVLNHRFYDGRSREQFYHHDMEVAVK